MCCVIQVSSFEASKYHSFIRTFISSLSFLMLWVNSLGSNPTQLQLRHKLIHIRVFNVETSQVIYTEKIVFCVPYHGHTAYLDMYTWYDQLISFLCALTHFWLMFHLIPPEKIILRGVGGAKRQVDQKWVTFIKELLLEEISKYNNHLN